MKPKALALCLLVSTATFMWPAQAMSLRELSVAALQHDPRFAASSAEITAVEYQLAAAKAGDQFTLGFAADVGRSDLRTRAPFPQSGARVPNSLALEASQPLYNGGRSAAERNAAKFGIHAAEQQRRDVGGKIILATLTAALDLKRDRETLKLAEYSLGTLKAAGRDVGKRFEAGEATKTDVAQADARRAESLANLERASAQLRIAEARLARLTGPLPASTLVFDWPINLPTPATLEEAIALSEHAPAVVAARQQQAAAEASVQIAASAGLPQLSLDAHAATQDNTEFGYQRLSTWGVQLKLKAPILTGGLVAAKKGEAVSRALMARSLADDEAASYAEAAASEWQLLRASDAVIEATRAQSIAAASALDGVRRELRVGSRTTLDLLNAERDALQAEVQLVSAQRDRAVTAFSLLAACGTLELHNLPE